MPAGTVTRCSRISRIARKGNTSGHTLLAEEGGKTDLNSVQPHERMRELLVVEERNLEERQQARLFDVLDNLPGSIFESV